MWRYLRFARESTLCTTNVVQDQGCASSEAAVAAYFAGGGDPELVMENRPDCLEYLLERGADRRLEDSYGYTPLRRFETYGHLDPAIGELLKD
jgi:hypothetical protein